jgi:hypothetical protein
VQQGAESEKSRLAYASDSEPRPRSEFRPSANPAVRLRGSAKKRVWRSIVAIQKRKPSVLFDETKRTSGIDAAGGVLCPSRACRKLRAGCSMIFHRAPADLSLSLGRLPRDASCCAPPGIPRACERISSRCCHRSWTTRSVRPSGAPLGSRVLGRARPATHFVGDRAGPPCASRKQPSVDFAPSRPRAPASRGATIGCRASIRRAALQRATDRDPGGTRGGVVAGPLLGAVSGQPTGSRFRITFAGYVSTRRRPCFARHPSTRHKSLTALDSLR